jgi:hypothetical protein
MTQTFRTSVKVLLRRVTPRSGDGRANPEGHDASHGGVRRRGLVVAIGPGCLPPIPTGPAGQAQRSGLPDGRTDCVRCGGAFRHEHSSVTRPSVCASEAAMCDGLPVDAPSPFSAP